LHQIAITGRQELREACFKDFKATISSIHIQTYKFANPEDKDVLADDNRKTIQRKFNVVV